MLAIDIVENYAYRRVMNKYISSFEEYFKKVFNLIDIRTSSLFQIIENLKENGIHPCDPKMISMIIQSKLDECDDLKICPKCKKYCTHNKYLNRELQTTLGIIHIKSPYLFCKDCKECFDPYGKILNLKSGRPPCKYFFTKSGIAGCGAQFSLILLCIQISKSENDSRMCIFSENGRITGSKPAIGVF